MALPSIFTLLWALLVVRPTGATTQRRVPYKLVEPQRWLTRSGLKFAEPALTMELKRGLDSSPSQRYLRTMVATTTNQTLVFSDGIEASYTTEISFGDRTFRAVVDTGSSDTWVVENNFTCIDPDSGASVDRSVCGFGPTYMSGGTFRQIPDQNFMTVYGDGEMLSGILGNETVTLANITISQQKIALVNTAYYKGDGVASALIGLAYPYLTSAYPGADASNDDPSSGHGVPYTPIFTSMYQKTGIAPVFSLALSRDNETGGVLAFGGLPSDVEYNGGFTSAPIKLMQIMQQTPNGTVTSYVYTYYAIAVQGIDVAIAGSATSEESSMTSVSAFTSVTAESQGSSLTSTADSTKTSATCTELDDPKVTEDPDLTKSETAFDFSTPMTSAVISGSQPPGTWWRSKLRRQLSNTITPPLQQPLVYIVDSGTTLLYVPDDIADAINTSFDPPAVYDEKMGAYFVDCDAKAPQVSVRISDTTFSINPADLILHNVTPAAGADVDPKQPIPCGSGVAAAGSDGLYVLGDVFLKNVLAVFDVGAGEMRFAARDY